MEQNSSGNRPRWSRTSRTRHNAFSQRIGWNLLAVSLADFSRFDSANWRRFKKKICLQRPRFFLKKIRGKKKKTTKKINHVASSYYLHYITVDLGPLNPQYWPLPGDLFEKKRQQQHVFTPDRTILYYVRHGVSQRLTGSRIEPHMHPKASVERWALLVNRISFLLIPSL